VNLIDKHNLYYIAPLPGDFFN